MKEHVKLLVIGEHGTGKSSLISAYISRRFDVVPSVITDAKLPAATTANGVAVTIMDSSSRLNLGGDREIVKQKIRVADCVLALYDVTRHETIDGLELTWLPLIRDVCGTCTGTTGKAVLVVGTKKDLLDYDDDHSLLRLKDEEERLKRVLSNFPFVSACYRCSAKDIDVDQIFYEGELAVSFPITPLFDVTKSELTEPCKRAFSHIFRIFDTNQDGLLDDKELCALQHKCFDVVLKGEEIAALKKEICKAFPGSVHSNRVTLAGFLGIMTLFIYRSQQQTPWTILNRFGYDENLRLELPAELSEEFLLAESYPSPSTSALAMVGDGGMMARARAWLWDNVPRVTGSFGFGWGVNGSTTLRGEKRPWGKLQWESEPSGIVAHQWFSNTNITIHHPAVITELSPEACEFLRSLATNASDRRAIAATLSETTTTATATATATATTAETAGASTTVKAAASNPPSPTSSAPTSVASPIPGPLTVTTPKSTGYPRRLHPSSPIPTPTNPVTASAAAALVSDSELFKTTSNISISSSGGNVQGPINYGVNGTMNSHGGTPTPTPSTARSGTNGGNGYHKRGLGQLYPSAAAAASGLFSPVVDNDRHMSWLDLQNSLAPIASVHHPWSAPPLCVDDEGGGTHVYLLAGCRPPPLGAPPATSASLNSSFAAVELPPSLSSKAHHEGLRVSSRIDDEGRGGGGASVGTPTTHYPTERVICDAVTTPQTSSTPAATCSHLLPPPVIAEDGPFCPVDAWIAQWQMLAVNRPTLTQALLYRLGFVDRGDWGVQAMSISRRLLLPSLPLFTPQMINDWTARIGRNDKTTYLLNKENGPSVQCTVGDRFAALLRSFSPCRRAVVHVCVLGGPGVGKADLVRACSRLSAIPVAPAVDKRQAQPQSLNGSDDNHNANNTTDKTDHPSHSRSLVGATGDWSDWTLAGSSLTGAQLGADAGNPSQIPGQISSQSSLAGAQWGLDSIFPIVSNPGDIVDGIVESIVDSIGIDAGEGDGAGKNHIKVEEVSGRRDQGGGGEEGGWTGGSMCRKSSKDDVYTAAGPFPPICDRTFGDPLFALRPSFHCDDLSSVNTGFQESVVVHGSTPWYESNGSGNPFPQQTVYCPNSQTFTSSRAITVVMTAVPYDRASEWMEVHGGSVDMAVFVVNGAEAPAAPAARVAKTQEQGIDNEPGPSVLASANSSEDNPSFRDARRLEARLPCSLPRIYVAKGREGDAIAGAALAATEGFFDASSSVVLTENAAAVSSSSSVTAANNTTPATEVIPPSSYSSSNLPLPPHQLASLQPVLDHLRAHDLPPLHLVSATHQEGLSQLLDLVVRVAGQPELALTSSYRRRRDDTRRALWYASAGAAIASSVVVGYFLVYGSGSSSERRRAQSTVQDSIPSHEMCSGSSTGCLDWFNFTILPTMSATLQASVVAVWDVLCDKCTHSFSLAKKAVTLASFAFREGSALIVTTAPDIANAVDHAATAATSMANGAAKGTLDAASNASTVVKDAAASVLSSGQGIAGQGVGVGGEGASGWSWMPKW